MNRFERINSFTKFQDLVCCEHVNLCNVKLNFFDLIKNILNDVMTNFNIEIKL